MKVNGPVHLSGVQFPVGDPYHSFAFYCLVQDLVQDLIRSVKVWIGLVTLR